MVNMELKNLKGKCLLAMPNVQDRFFRSALVLVTSVDDFHVRGLIVNKPSDQLVSDILNQMNIDIGLGFEDQRILHGGPVRRDRLYLSYFPRALTEQTMTPIFSNELKDLQLIANSQGMRYIACVGECEWEHEQLCDEIASNYWLIVSCSHDVLFDCDYNDRVKLVLSRLGISLEQLSSISGRA